LKDLYTSMAESSSDSDHVRYRDGLSRWATRSFQRGVGSHSTVDVTAKVNTITNTLQVSLTVVAFDRFLIV
jgi:centrosomal protein CEP128